MIIEIDRSAIFAKERAIGGKKGVKIEAAGYYDDHRKIFLAPDNSLSKILTYCHEIGHFMADRFSFKDGNCLSFDEIKHKRIYIDLNLSEINFLKANIHNNKHYLIDSRAIKIADKLLDKFFIGNFHPEEVDVRPITKKRMHTLILKTGYIGAKKVNGKYVIDNSRQARDVEIPSMYTEFGCLLMFENTLKKYRILDFNEQLFTGASLSPSHQRAMNIIAKAHLGNGWILPSMVDIRNK